MQYLIGPLLLIFYLIVAFFPILITFIISFILGTKYKKAGLKRFINGLIVIAGMTFVSAYLLLPIYLALLCPFMHFPGTQCGAPTFLDLMYLPKLLPLVLLNIIFLYVGVLVKHIFKFYKHAK